MYVYCYGLSDEDKEYTSQLAGCECIEGDKTELIHQVKSDKKFCRNQEGIDYTYFVQSIRDDSFIYIKDESGKILGACTFSLGEVIILYSICVPNNGITGIGTLLLDKLKCIGNSIGAKSVKLSASKLVQEFYLKNGFILDDAADAHDDDDGMVFYFERNSATARGKTRGKTRKATSQKKAKRGTRKAKRGRRKAKRGKTSRQKTTITF